MRSVADILDDLKKAIKDKRDSVLAQELGMTRQGLQSRRSRASLPFEEVAAFCERRQLSLDLLLFGRSPASLPAASHTAPQELGYSRIDIYYAAGAGSPVSLIEGEPIDELWLRQDLMSKGVVVVKVRGWSMAPTIMDGAYVGVDINDRQIVSGELYAVWINGEGALIKRLTVEPGSRVHIISDNVDSKRYPTWVRSFKELDEHFVQGRVKWVLQKV